MRFHHLVIVAAGSLAGVVQAQDYTHYQGAWNGPFLLYVAQQDSGAQGESQVFPGNLLIESNGMVLAAYAKWRERERDRLTRGDTI